MANSKYEYVKSFERDEILLPNTWIVIRVDGKGFHRLSGHYNFAKATDRRAIHLMNRAATTVLQTLTDITLAYGHSDEYSFLFPPSTTLYSRRLQKLVSTVTSVFTSAYVAHWDQFFEARRLDMHMLPSFDGRAVLFPTVGNVRDYFAWRQVDCHVNALYNTTFWAMVLGSRTAERDLDEGSGKSEMERLNEQSQEQQNGEGEKLGFLKPEAGSTKRKMGAVEPMAQTEAELRLKGTTSADKNEILWHDYGINYNNVSSLERKGSVVWREMSIEKKKQQSDGDHEHGDVPGEDKYNDYEPDKHGLTVDANPPAASLSTAVPITISKTQAEKAKKARRKAEIVVGHVDIIKDAFWRERPWILE